MDREALENPFRKENIPEYTCPHCAKGVLRLSGEFFSEETKVSAAVHGEDWWEPEYIVLLFKCILQCSYCADLVFVVGDGFVEEEYDVDQDGEWSRDWVEYYKPEFFHPPLQLISYPSKASKDTIEPLSLACALFFKSPSSCCNAIRTSAEQILTYLNVPVLSDEGKYISFANRIKKLPEQEGSIANLFNAIRWIGNHGSHPGNKVEAADALHALEIMEFLLEEVYGGRKQEVAALAAAINDKKGPVGRLFKLGVDVP